jgi:hypothetical protein
MILPYNLGTRSYVPKCLGSPSHEISHKVLICKTGHYSNKTVEDDRCIRLDDPAARCSGRPKLPRQFVPVRNFEPRLFVPMPGNMGRPAFTFINLYIFCNLQRIINKNIHLGYVCTCVYILLFVIRLFVCWQAH